MQNCSPGLGALRRRGRARARATHILLSRGFAVNFPHGFAVQLDDPLDGDNTVAPLPAAKTHPRALLINACAMLSSSTRSKRLPSTSPAARTRFYPAAVRHDKQIQGAVQVDLRDGLLLPLLDELCDLHNSCGPQRGFNACPGPASAQSQQASARSRQHGSTAAQNPRPVSQARSFWRGTRKSRQEASSRSNTEQRGEAGVPFPCAVASYLFLSRQNFCVAREA